MNSQYSRGITFLKRLLSSTLFLLLLALSFSLKEGISPSCRAAPPLKEESSSSFGRAELSAQVLFYLQHNYYDPARFNARQMLKSGLLAMARSVPEIVVDFPENSNTVTVAVEHVEKKFSAPSSKEQLAPLIPFLQQVFSFIEKNYKGEVEISDIERNLLNGMLESLDPHSSLLPPKVFKEFRTQTEGEFGGVGIVIGLRDGDLTVISPIEGTPAWRAGIKPKDKIIQIGAEATINMNLNDAVEKLRGKIGTAVLLTLTREGKSDPFEVTLTRAKIKINSVQSSLIRSPEGDVGYVKVKNFQEDTYRELVRSLKKIKSESKNFKGLILDFRSDPGGLLNQAIQIADLFLDKGVIVSTVGAGNKIREVEEARELGTEEGYPMIVLVNESSASASEIVAGAFKNNNRAVVVGQQTFGKGSVQSVYNLKDGSALKLTIAQYLTPGNESIQSVGITPDIELIPATVTATRVQILPAEGFREKDLEKHLESNLNQSSKPAYQIRYFLPSKAKGEGEGKEGKEKDPEEESNEYSSELKLHDDYYVNLGKKLLLNASGPNRQEMLKGYAALIEASQKEEEQKIIQAFSQVGIDWAKGTSSELPVAEVTFLLEGKQPGEPLLAGEEAQLTLKIKNTGKSDFYQLMAKTESENPLFKNKEFPLGRLRVGETRSWTQKIKISDAALSREDEIKFVFSEANNKIPQTFVTLLTVRPKPRPTFAYSYQLIGAAGGALKAGDKITLKVTVKNVGAGKAKETVVNLKNLEGEGVFVSSGRSKLQEIEPNASKEANLAFNLGPSYSKPKVGFDLSILDSSSQESLLDKLKFSLGKPTSTPGLNQFHRPPEIRVEGVENLRSTSSGKISLTGQVSSEAPLKDVMVYVNNNKVFLKSAEKNSSQKISFSLQAPLENNKNNLITIVSRNERDLAAYRSFYVRKK